MGNIPFHDRIINFLGDANNFLNEIISKKEEPEALEKEHDRKRKRDAEKTSECPPLHLRPRKLSFWDQRPEGYGNMSADQVKATGMFLLPSHLLKGI